ncbi:hypothetical protein MUN78_04380 [Leucobacter allii]|uniref:Calcineurin-like phosphoesterase domain-containing protein n=1 Tax=Leucobacter allii TaxID=2932247 RepID=A0ABY4FP83_9MICO|nr:hypothetical protein [Leucobacter allii]UOQ58088.1 hypothetical protein MUN78_04380 [Leucobacter allii]
MTITPGRREGQSVVLLTDGHAGRVTASTDFLTESQHRMCGIDVDWLASFATVVGLAGDNINYSSPTLPAEDPEALAWLQARDRSHASYLVTTGNHDYANAATHEARGIAAWQAAMGGLPKYSHAPAGETAAAGLQVVALSQESMTLAEWLSPAAAAADERPQFKPGRGFALTDNSADPLDQTTALGYLRRRLATGRPTWLMVHYPPQQQYGSSYYLDGATSAAITQIASTSPNLVGILSGHYHANPFRSPDHVKPLTIGDRTIAGINGPAWGGAMSAAGGEPLSYPFESPFIATVVTYAPGTVIVRWRDLIRRRWVKSIHGYRYEFPVSCTAPIA